MDAIASIPPYIGRYRVDSYINQGGMGLLLCAHDPSFDRTVAIKWLAISNEVAYQRFQNEMILVAACRCDAIVPVYDSGLQDGHPYLVMQFMSGGSLADRLRSGRLTIPAICAIAERLASALDMVHARGIIHRDIKPANVLFDENGRAYLSDFGIARQVEDPIHLTGTQAIGTAAYMSPEQAQNDRSVDGRSDIYSLGVVLFEMLTGRLPYTAQNIFALAHSHVYDPIPSLRSIEPSLPVALEGLIQRALAKDPSMRYATATELFRDLQKIVEMHANDQLLSATGTTPPVSRDDPVANRLNAARPPTPDVLIETTDHPIPKPRRSIAVRRAVLGTGVILSLGFLALFWINYPLSSGSFATATSQLPLVDTISSPTSPSLATNTQPVQTELAIPLEITPTPVIIIQYVTLTSTSPAFTTPSPSPAKTATKTKKAPDPLRKPENVKPEPYP